MESKKKTLRDLAEKRKANPIVEIDVPGFGPVQVKRLTGRQWADLPEEGFGFALVAATILDENGAPLFASVADAEAADAGLINALLMAANKANRLDIEAAKKMTASPISAEIMRIAEATGRDDDEVGGWPLEKIARWIAWLDDRQDKKDEEMARLKALIAGCHGAEDVTWEDFMPPRLRPKPAPADEREGTGALGEEMIERALEAWAAKLG